MREYRTGNDQQRPRGTSTVYGISCSFLLLLIAIVATAYLVTYWRWQSPWRALAAGAVVTLVALVVLVLQFNK
jgi:membrane protein YdbS with pleckstrin-like domain